MAKVYEAMRRAEEERKRRAGSEPSPVAPVEWEPLVQTVTPSKSSLWKRMFGRSRPRAQRDAAVEHDVHLELVVLRGLIRSWLRILVNFAAGVREVRSAAVAAVLLGELRLEAFLRDGLHLLFRRAVEQVALMVAHVAADRPAALRFLLRCATSWRRSGERS